MNYLRPTDASISASWQSHKNRNPPSAEPGTDYACAYGTDLAMAESGIVSVVDNSAGGGEGRRLSVDLDDGRRVSYIHLSRIPGYIGQRVGRGQRGIAISGASGNGSDWYYGPHVHVSLWERPGMSYAATIDFENYVGDGTPVPDPTPIELKDDEMILIKSNDTYPDGSLMRAPMVIAAGYTFWPPSQEAVDAAAAICDRTIVGNARQFDLWMATAQQGTTYGVPVPAPPATPPATMSHRLLIIIAVLLIVLVAIAATALGLDVGDGGHTVIESMGIAIGAFTGG